MAVPTVNEHMPYLEDTLMTIALQLEQKGFEKDRAEGLQLGEQRSIEKKDIQKGSASLA